MNMQLVFTNYFSADVPVDFNIKRRICDEAFVFLTHCSKPLA